MYKLASLVCLCLTGLTVGYPSPVIHQLGEGPRFQYATDSKGNNHLVDLALTVDNVIDSARYNPTLSNVYHLFTSILYEKSNMEPFQTINLPIPMRMAMDKVRAHSMELGTDQEILVYRTKCAPKLDNPTVSQPLLINVPDLLQSTNYQSRRRTVILIHGWFESASADSNSVLIPAFLEAEDVNVIVVDWSGGASSIEYRTVIRNTIASGQAVAEFINWLNEVTESSAVQYHIVGHGFGGHQAGIVGRYVQGDVAYITGLDPALIGWVNHIDRFSPDDGLYTEVIHTNYGINGFLADLAQVDFYPNGGVSMPGCETNACDHARSYFYFAESLLTGGFTGRQCLNYFAAVLNSCDLLPGRLQMGGLRPKNGSRGVYLLETNPAPPFSQG